MAKAIKLSDELVVDAATHGKAQHRSAPRQIEYWARIGKIADENPDLTLGFVKDILTGFRDLDSGETKPTPFPNFLWMKSAHKSTADRFLGN